VVVGLPQDQRLAVGPTALGFLGCQDGVIYRLFFVIAAAEMLIVRFHVRSVMGETPPAEPVTEEIVAKADDNPLFLEQLALHAGEAKSSRSELMVPNTIHDVVMARIDRLPGEA
jgi:hypothetical protein